MLKFRSLSNNKRLKKNRFSENEKGSALIESIPVLFMMAVVFNLSLGFFGAIHSGILNSIGSYNYAIETFRFRSNLMYFRPGSVKNYKNANNRVHGIVKDGSDEDDNAPPGTWPTTVRAITFNYSKTDSSRSLASLQQACDTNDCRTYSPDDPANIWHAGSEYKPDGSSTLLTPRIWVKTVYGICITADCEHVN